MLSDIDFFLENSTTLGGQIKIIVQHQQGPNMTFNRKCQIIHRNEWPLDCQTQDPCMCGNFTSGTFEYKLKMVFSQADSGRWQFAIFSGASVDITIHVKGELLWISVYLSERAYLIVHEFSHLFFYWFFHICISLSFSCLSFTLFTFLLCNLPKTLLKSDSLSHSISDH